MELNIENIIGLTRSNYCLDINIIQLCIYDYYYKNRIEIVGICKFGNLEILIKLIRFDYILSTHLIIVCV